jgi:Gpi18-like mannosyltransferase
MKNLKFNALKILGRLNFADILIILIGSILAFLLRYLLRGYESSDVREFNQVWYSIIKSHGIAAIGTLSDATALYDYPPAYSYLLYIVSILFPKLSSVSAIKLIPSITDCFGAWTVYKIVRLKYLQGPIPLFAAFIFLFAPTIVLNSALWGQTDSIYTVFLLATIYFILKKQNWWSCLAFGFAFSFKLQALFLAPFLLALCLKREISWKQLLLIPAVYLVLIIPAWIAGRPIWELLTIYIAWTGQTVNLEMYFPNIYYQLPDKLFNLLYPETLIVTVSVVFLYIASIYKSHIKINLYILIQLALVSVIIMPYFLPKMHDRYLYPADAISIIYGFYFPQYYFIPILINLISFFIYENVLFGMSNVSLYVLQLALILVIVLLAKQMITLLYSNRKPGDNKQ